MSASLRSETIRAQIDELLEQAFAAGFQWRSDGTTRHGGYNGGLVEEGFLRWREQSAAAAIVVDPPSVPLEACPMRSVDSIINEVATEAMEAMAEVPAAPQTAAPRPAESLYLDKDGVACALQVPQTAAPDMLLTLKRKIQERIAVSQDAAFAAAKEGNQGLADYHAGCLGMGACILEDLEEVGR